MLTLHWKLKKREQQKAWPYCIVKLFTQLSHYQYQLLHPINLIRGIIKAFMSLNHLLKGFQNTPLTRTFGGADIFLFC